MTAGDRAPAVLSEFADRYFFCIEEDGETRLGISDIAYAREVIPKLDDALNHLEHKEKRAKERNDREASKSGQGGQEAPE